MPISWVGLILAHVHPALSLVFVVPCLPAVTKVDVRSTQSSEKERGGGEMKESELIETHRTSIFSHSKTDAAFHHACTPSEYRRKAYKRQLSMDLSSIASKLDGATPYVHDRHAPLHQFEHVMKFPV